MVIVNIVVLCLSVCDGKKNGACEHIWPGMVNETYWFHGGPTTTFFFANITDQTTTEGVFLLKVKNKVGDHENSQLCMFFMPLSPIPRCGTKANNFEGCGKQ